MNKTIAARRALALPPTWHLTGRRLLLLTLLLILLLGGLLLLWRQAQPPPPLAELPAPPLPIIASGTLLPQRRATLSFTGTGRISHLYVVEGERVSTGQPLARLEPTVLAAEPLQPASEVYLTAPFAGTIGQIAVRQWETVTPGLPVIQLGDLTHLRVEVADLSEADIGQVRIGQPVTLTFEAFTDRLVGGAITEIAPMAADSKGRPAYRVMIEVDQLPEGARWGMTANIDIPIDAPPTVTPPADRQPGGR